MSVNGPISPKQCYYEMDYSFYSFYWLDSLETRLDHNSTYYRSLSKNSDVKPRISHYDSQNLQYKTHPEFWPSHRRIFKTILYYKTRLILETRQYASFGLNELNTSLSLRAKVLSSKMKWDLFLIILQIEVHNELMANSIHKLMKYIYSSLCMTSQYCNN